MNLRQIGDWRIAVLLLHEEDADVRIVGFFNAFQCLDERRFLDHDGRVRARKQRPSIERNHQHLVRRIVDFEDIYKTQNRSRAARVSKSEYRSEIEQQRRGQVTRTIFV